MKSHRNFSLNSKRELVMTSSDAMETCQPLGVARRHGSVEGRSISTTSPFSSTYSLEEDSPTMYNRTKTPIDHNSTPYPQQSYDIREALLQAVEYHWNMLQPHTPSRGSDESSEAMEIFQPLGVSRRHGAVESRSTTSSFTTTYSLGGNSPTMHNRTNTPIDHYSTPYSQQSHGISEALLQAVEYHWNMLQPHTPTRGSDESSDSSSYPMGKDEDLSRHFKKYRRERTESQSDSSSSNMNSSSVDVEEDGNNFMTFRSKMLQEMNGRQRIVSNPNMRRNWLENRPGSSNDAAYNERRQKNNAASKASRDRRKMREIDLSIRVAFLEKENVQLKIVRNRLKAQINTFDASEWKSSSVTQQ